MNRIAEFTFHNSFIANNYAFSPLEDPIHHLLPPQQPISKANHRGEKDQKSNVSASNSKNGYIDITLGNSPQFSHPLQRNKMPQTISHFNKKMDESHLKKSINDTNKSNLSVTHVSQNKNDSKMKESMKTDHHLSNSKVPNSDRMQGQSSTYRQNHSKIQRLCNSGLSQMDQIYNRNTSRNPREDSIYVEDSIKRKFTNKNNSQRQQSPSKEIIALANKIQQLKNRLFQVENNNKTLTAQLKINREKSKNRESEISLLKQKIEELTNQIFYFRPFQDNYRGLQKELNRQIKINESCFEEIDQQKELIIKHEDKSAQSIKLLQKLNRNIEKQQFKFKKELQSQLSQYNKLLSQNQRLKNEVLSIRQSCHDIEHKKSDIQLKNQKMKSQLQNEIKRSKEEINLLKDEISKLKEEERNRSKDQINRSREQINRWKDEINTLKEEERKKLQETQNIYQEKINSLIQNMDKARRQFLEMQKIKQKMQFQIEQLTIQINYLTKTNQILIINNKQQISIISSQKQRQTLTLQEQIKSLKQEIENQKQKHQQQMQRFKKLNDENKSQERQSFQQSLTAFKSQISINQQKMEKLFYEYKQLEMKYEILMQNNQQNLYQIKDLKQQKKIIFNEKQEYKNDTRHLIEKNDKLYLQLQRNKAKEINLNELISNYQKEIIDTEERISQHLTTIASQQMQAINVNSKLEYQAMINQSLQHENENKSKNISQLQQKLKKYEKLINIYKEEINKIKNNKQVQWSQMKSFYESQIETLESKLQQVIEKAQKRDLKAHESIIHQLSIIQQEEYVQKRQRTGQINS